ncbi:DUF4232 domain-containing protein [Promicromonospora sp. CA-289599]|uniref:DUF4232 domain-containing protein n=1 Tax=Promicromonospora sp. CA-289599 TaxID=3240014 RepID=UPI003D8EE0E4
MSPLHRALALAAVSALVLAGCTRGAGQPPAEIRTAADSVRGLDGVIAVEVTRSSPIELARGNFGQREQAAPSTVSVRVMLDETLGAGDAGAVTAEAQSLLVADADLLESRDQVSLSVEYYTETEESGPTQSGYGQSGYGEAPSLHVTTGAGPTTEVVGDAATDAYHLREAGAVLVTISLGDGPGTWEDDPIAATAQVRAPSIDALPGLARTAVELDRSADLSASGADFRSAARVPDVGAVALLVAAVERPDVSSATYLAQERRLTVRADTTSPAQDLTALRRWLDRQEYARASGYHVAYTIVDAEQTEATGWVSGFEPPAQDTDTLPLPEGTTPWPVDPAAPDCTGDDLEVTFGVVDSSLGTRAANVRARNLSGAPCAIENVPELIFRNEAGQAQENVTITPGDVGPARVVVPDGEYVLSAFLWRAMSTVNDPDTTTTVEVTAVAGADPVRLDATMDGTRASGLDILDGAEVRQSPWTQAGPPPEDPLTSG